MQRLMMAIVLAATALTGCATSPEDEPAEDASAAFTSGEVPYLHDAKTPQEVGTFVRALNARLGSHLRRRSAGHRVVVNWEGSKVEIHEPLDNAMIELRLKIIDGAGDDVLECEHLMLSEAERTFHAGPLSPVSLHCDDDPSSDATHLALVAAFETNARGVSYFTWPLATPDGW
jgi:hypothetical protein